MVAEKMASSSGTWVALPDRGLISVAGADACDFLQGIVTNDMETVSDSRAVYAALLTPQGKYLHDFFVFRIGSVLYLDCEAARCDDLMRRLAVYRLRADIAIEDASDAFAVYALFGVDVWRLILKLRRMKRINYLQKSSKKVGWAMARLTLSPQKECLRCQALQPYLMTYP